mmetsp:Transcript_52381/g.133131  ORF Transcript_52381/g.133131 Transcript_52381/m.133131 type:complete len:214 (+) Transcript_52381:126-767(+)
MVQQPSSQCRDEVTSVRLARKHKPRGRSRVQACEALEEFSEVSRDVLLAPRIARVTRGERPACAQRGIREEQRPARGPRLRGRTTPQPSTFVQPHWSDLKHAAQHRCCPWASLQPQNQRCTSNSRRCRSISGALEVPIKQRSLANDRNETTEAAYAAKVLAHTAKIDAVRGNHQKQHFTAHCGKSNHQWKQSLKPSEHRMWVEPAHTCAQIKR